MHLQSDVKEIKERATQLHTLSNSLPGIMTYQVLREHDGTMRFTYLSESVEKITGKTPEEVIKDPKILYDLVHEDDRHKISKAEDISYQTMSILDIVVRSRTSIGEVRWLHIRSVPRTMADGRVAWDGVHIDITETMEKEKLLSEKETQLRLFVENNPAAIAMFDKDMKYIIASKRWTVDYNLEHSDIIGKSHYEIFPEISQQWKDIHQRCLAGSIEKNEEDLFIRANGNKDWVRWEIHPWYTISGEVGGIILLTEVITDRKKAEQELERSEKNLRNVLSSMADDFYAIDLNYNIIIINEAAERNLEKSWGRPVKAGTNILDLVPGTDNQRLQENFRKVFAGEKIEYEAHHTTSGPSWWSFVSLIPVTDEKGNIIGAHVTTRDISERKNAEEAIKQSEERYRILVENAPEALVVLDTINGRFVSVSETAVTLFKMSKEDLLKTGPIELSPEYQPDGSLSSEYGMKKINEAINGGKPIFEWMHHDSEGKSIPTEVRLVRLPSEKQVLIRGSIIDITERKKNEDKLRKSEERYRSLIEQASDAIMITDLKGNFIDVNSSLCEMFGYDKQELLQSKISSLIDPQQLKERPIQFDELKKGKHVFSHRRMIHKNGTIIEVEANVKMISDGSVLAIARDITERKKAADIIRTSEETRRLIMNSALDAIILMDAAGFVTGWNQQAEKIFGWKEAEILGKPLSDSIIPEQFRMQHKKGLAHYLQTGNAAVLNKLIEITAVNSKGNEFPVELSIVPIKQGADISFCGFLRDISERKKAEQMLIESENRLRTILNTEPECIKLLSSNGELLDMNPAGLEMIEADNLEQVKGQCVEMLIAPAYKKQFHQLTIDVFKGGSGRLEFEMIGLKGTRRWMETHAVPLKDAEGKINSLLSVTRDITERKKGEEDLLREKNLSDSIINSLPGIFYLYDETGKFLRWNKNFEAVSGYNAVELSKLHPLDFFDGDEKELVKEKIKEAFEKGMSEMEAFAVVKSKEKIPFYFTGCRVIFEDKPCLIGVGIDVTKRKKAEMEMFVAKELLKNSYEDIRRLASHLEKIREEERITIAREIHDELGQQLTVLKMDISWINKNMLLKEEKGKQKIKDLLQMIDLTIKTVRRISSELRPSVLDDLGLIAALEWLSNDFEKRSGIKTTFVTDITYIDLDAGINTALFRIFQESLTNVARHAQASEVYASLKKENDKLLISIKDNGKGFVISSIANKKTLGILGIKERVALLQGEYEIISFPGQGSTIKVMVPVSSITEPKTSQ